MNEITKPNDALTAFTQLGDVTLFEPAGNSPHQERHSKRIHKARPVPECVAHLQTPKGPKPVLKTMVTTACERNCNYCPFRAGRYKAKRMTFTPDAIAGAFDTMERKKQVDGLFLSSGIIKGSVTTQDKLIDTVEIVRRIYQYRGYIHLKVMPGVERDQLYRAMQLADRVSVNMEAPTEQRLHALAPKKQFLPELLTMLQWAEQIRQDNPHQKLASTVTQFVVGAVGDTDLELLSLTQKLHSQAGLARTYYSAFHPVLDTPFENLPAVEAIREFRLYQSSFLLRDYGWNVEEFPFLQDGNLRTDIDPKEAWADENLRHAPIDLMTADREQLLRVPMIGPKSANAILRARHKGTLLDLNHLRKIGIRAPDKAAPYILLNGVRPLRQMKLF